MNYTPQQFNEKYLNECFLYNKDTGVLKWGADIRVMDDLNYLGVFVHKVDAIIARKMAEYKHGFQDIDNV